MSTANKRTRDLRWLVRGHKGCRALPTATSLDNMESGNLKVKVLEGNTVLGHVSGFCSPLVCSAANLDVKLRARGGAVALPPGEVPLETSGGMLLMERGVEDAEPFRDCALLAGPLQSRVDD